MPNIRTLILVLGLSLSPLATAAVQVSISIGVPAYPRLVVVPGYPVYYAPQVQANYFFYDGMYWVYQADNWYASSWYNGPWWYVEPYAVPVYILRVPVRYYRQPPAYFRGWRPDAPPRWSNHWGREWQQKRSGWDTWDRRAAPPPAPLPAYQRLYSGDRYPRQIEQQYLIQQQRYPYQPRDPVVQQRYQQREQVRPSQRVPTQQNRQDATNGTRTQTQQRDNVQRPAASVRPDNGVNPRDTRQGPQPWLDPREPQARDGRTQDRTAPPPHSRDPAQRNDGER
ncbi:MAG: hypothetical protein Q8R61_13815 [Thiobacillus sp.]|uniref:hypothetical protein n=1 Tax=Thiobacillus sp. TaxID=924 RepID=UPI002732E608|nr:hypothetical protein [Thiobacillus sp.]MDP3586202.1 hypothetical protein [Thiobacillus sp.]